MSDDGPNALAPEGPQPLVRPLPPGRPYPAASLGPIGPVAEAVQAMTGAPLGIPAQSALAVAAFAVQPFADVESIGGFVPISIYALTIAESGARKSTCDRLLMAALREYEKQQAASWRKDTADWENQLGLWKGAREQILAEGRRSRGEKKVAAEADLEALGPMPLAPPSPDRIVTEPTSEGLTRLLSTGQPSVGLFSDEGGQFLGGHGMSLENRQKTLAYFNDLWGGSPIRRTRAGDGTYALFGRRLSMHLMVQPIIGHELMADSLATGLGFLPRVLICEPPSTFGQRLSHRLLRHDPGPIAAFNARLLAILERSMPLANPETRELQPRRLPLSPEARDLLTVFSDAVEQRQAPGRDLVHVRGYASKIAEHAARISGVLTLFPNLEAPQVEAQTMRWAVELADYYLSESVRLASNAVLSIETARAEELRHWLRAEWPHREIMPREILQYGPSALRESSKVKAAAQLLEDHGWLVTLEAGTKIRGATRKKAWRIVSE